MVAIVIIRAMLAIIKLYQDSEKKEKKRKS